MTTLRRTSIAAATLLGLSLGLGACSPDRSDQVDELERAVEAMPGVEDVLTTYSNDFTAGKNLSIDVTMSEQAAEDEISDVVAAVAEQMGDDFDDYQRETEISLPDGRRLVLGDRPDAEEVARQLPRLRELRGVVSGGFLTWHQPPDGHSGWELELSEVPDDPLSVLDAVRTVLEDEPMRVAVTGAEGPQWTVDFPFSADAQEAIVTALTDSAAEVETVAITDDQVAALRIESEDDPQAADRLTATIDTVNETSSGDWMLTWSASSDEGDRKFAGSVHVGGCDYDTNTVGEKEPERYYTPSAIDLRDQLRERFDTCD